MGLTLKEFVEMGDKSVEYDFKCEYPWLNLKDIDNPIERFLKYKATGDSFDCDCSYLANEIYAELWGCTLIPGVGTRYCAGPLKEKLCGQNKKIPCLLERETMNSFWTTFKFALQVCKKSTIGFYANWPTIKGIEGLNIKDECERIKTASADLYKALEEFAWRTHTIGNFTMLINPDIEKYPFGFNSGRTKKTFDYWDLSLKLMEKDLGAENSELYKAYLEEFDLKDEKYEDAIANLFNVDECKATDTWTWVPKSKDEGGIEQLICFIDNVNQKIERRSENLIKKLKEKRGGGSI
jgi:hypothetical protein